MSLFTYEMNLKVHSIFSVFYLALWIQSQNCFRKFAETVNFISDEEHDLSGRHTGF